MLGQGRTENKKMKNSLLGGMSGGSEKACCSSRDSGLVKCHVRGEKYEPVVPASFLLVRVVHICLICKIPTSRCRPVIFPAFGLLWRNSKSVSKDHLCKQQSWKHPSLVLPINLAFLAAHGLNSLSTSLSQP